MSCALLQVIIGDGCSRPPESLATRPYPARVHGVVLHPARLVGGRQGGGCLCGVGSVGLEAISRGAREAFFVEQDRRVANLLQENIESMDCADRAEVLRADAFSPLVRLRLGQDCDIVSLDPPYAMMQEETLAKVLEAAVGYASCLRPGGWFVLRTPEDPEHTPHDIDGLLGPEVHAYGRDMFVLLYQRPPRPTMGQAECQAACHIVRALKGAGHEAVLAGGCVRDRLLGIVPKDYDVATSATPNK